MIKTNIVTGHYGSGKTEFAINLSMKLKNEGKKVSVCDLDIVNPYFRTNDAKEFLEKVRKKGYHTYVISNASYRFHDYFPTFYNVEEFKGIVVSADLHIIKPDARIYQYLLDTYQLKAEECLFLDDVAANVEGAKAVGMQSIQFHGNYDEIEGYLDEMVD